MEFILPFILAIVILVTVHEWGHYIAARLTGMRAEIFSIGMGKRLFGWNKKTGFTFGNLPEDFIYDGDTDWRVCLFPIGGYVKISGMIDESYDTSGLTAEPKSYEFRSKNTFQKAFVLSNGVFMNFVLTFLIFSYLIFSDGEVKSATTEIAFVKQNSLSDKFGFKADDKVLSVNDKNVETWEDFISNITIDNLGEKLKVKVLRSNSEKVLNFDSKLILKEISNEENKDNPAHYILGLEKKYQNVVVSDVLSLTPAEKSGLKSGDTIFSLNSTLIQSGQQFSEIIKSSKRESVNITFIRNDKIYHSILKPDNGKIGIYHQTQYKGPINVKDFNIVESLQLGFFRTFDVINLIFKSFGQISNGNIAVKDALGGPITIAVQTKKFADEGYKSFLFLIAQLSLSLALINILPIPALDGGHLIVVLIEGIRRKELPLKVKILLQNIGVILLLLLMVLIFYLDLSKI